MIRKFKRRSVTLLLPIVTLLLTTKSLVFGYTISSIIPKYDDPSSVSVYISSTVPYINDVQVSYDNWDHLPFLDTYRSYDLDYAEAYITYSAISNGTYADVGQIGNSDWKQMTIRPPWKNLNTTRKRETIAHEMGHCWGLGHGDNNALMRALGFNDYVYPVADDNNGIYAIYD